MMMKACPPRVCGNSACEASLCWTNLTSPGLDPKPYISSHNWSILRWFLNQKWRGGYKLQLSCLELFNLNLIWPSKTTTKMMDFYVETSKFLSVQKLLSLITQNFFTFRTWSHNDNLVVFFSCSLNIYHLLHLNKKWASYEKSKIRTMET